MSLSRPQWCKFQIPAPDKLHFYYQLLPAVSPDGQRIAFAASSTPFNFDVEALRSFLECSHCDGDPDLRFFGRLSLLVAGLAADRIHLQWNPPESGPIGGTAGHHL